MTSAELWAATNESALDPNVTEDELPPGQGPRSPERPHIASARTVSVNPPGTPANSGPTAADSGQSNRAPSVVPAPRDNSSTTVAPPGGTPATAATTNAATATPGQPLNAVPTTGSPWAPTGTTTSTQQSAPVDDDNPDQLTGSLDFGTQMLPILASALSSLADGNGAAVPKQGAGTTNADRAGSGKAQAPDTSALTLRGPSPAEAVDPEVESADDAAATGLSPAAQRAIRALRMLAAAYGNGNPTDPEIIELRKMLGLTPGSGGAASGSRAQQLFQRTAATAFNNLDNQLARYVTELAGNHQVDRTKLTQLIREVNGALATLGPHAYTRAGHARVHQILTAALQKAHTIVSAGQSTAKDMAAHVERLTAQYLWNINGQRQATYGNGTAGAWNGPTAVGQGGSIGLWIQQALAILRQSGTDMSKVDPAAIAIIAQYESTNNPHAINLTDSNAAKGTPSKGLMQTIDGTFRQYALPGYTDIWNPVHNIIASVRYSLDRYGSLANVPGVKAVRAGGRYVGY